jgi:hypothetical protein
MGGWNSNLVDDLNKDDDTEEDSQVPAHHLS